MNHKTVTHVSEHLSPMSPVYTRILAGGETTGTDAINPTRPGWGAGRGLEDDMPSTHLSLHYHLIFSTKDRAALIHKDWCGRLHAYMGGIINDLGGVPETIGGVKDHVHILVGLRATHRVADVLKEIKSSSSKWVHDEIRKPLFSWQEGYGAFTVSASQLASVKNYIANQEEHHRKKSFQEEYLDFLKQSGVEYDEKYLW